MTDDNERQEPNPTRKSRPGGLEETTVGDAAVEAEAVAEPAAEVRVDAPPEGDATGGDETGDVVEAKGEPGRPDDVTVEPGDDDRLAAAEDADEAPVADASERGDTAIAHPVESESAVDDEPDAVASGPVAHEDDSAAETETVVADVAPSEAKATPATGAVAGDQRSDTFTWHPEHKGKTFDEVRANLAQDLAADQRQHRLAMDGAEESEQEALASVVGLERKWGKYDFDWAEQEPDALADRIVEFERERERRRQMISWSDYRERTGSVDTAQVEGDRPAELSTSAKGLSLLLVVLLIVVILLAVWAL